ncbi:MAG: prepilin-type N-terminal cleavage/methylation domain-containing protein [Oscillospiraceae bacterium]
MKNKLQKAKANNKGFTLVELIVVIAILGVLMAVLVPQYIQYVEKSRIGADEAMIGEIGHAMEVAAANQGDLTTYTVTVTSTAGAMTSGTAPGTPVTAGDFFKEVTAITPIITAKTKSTHYKDGITVTLTSGKATVTIVPIP